MKNNKNFQPETGDETMVKTAQTNLKKSRKSWQSVLVGGVPGILLGAGGVVLTEAFTAVGESPANDLPDAVPATDSGAMASELQIADSVQEEMSFREAFDAAREEVGPGGAFSWHGNVYSTYRAEDPEWADMSQEQREAYSHEIIANVHPQPYTPTSDEPAVIPVEEEIPAETSEADEMTEAVDPMETTGSPEPVETVNDEDAVSSVEPDEGEDVDVHIVGTTLGETEEEFDLAAGIAKLYAKSVLVDDDGDGVVETVIIDEPSHAETVEVEVQEEPEAEPEAEPELEPELEPEAEPEAELEPEPEQIPDQMAEQATVESANINTSLEPEIPDITTEGDADSLV